MTVQFPDVLINEHPQLDMTSLYLYSVIRGDVYSNHGWGEPYKFSRQRKPPEKAVISSALWRGHIATFRLQSNGELILEEHKPYVYAAAIRI